MFELIIIAVLAFAAGGAIFGTIGANSKKNIEATLTDYYEGVIEEYEDVVDDLKEKLKPKAKKAKPAA